MKQNYLVADSQTYLVKDVFEHRIHNLVGSKRVPTKFPTAFLIDVVLLRSDKYTEMKWSNHGPNWPYAPHTIRYYNSTCKVVQSSIFCI
jgi:hypothetical protein